MALPLTCVLVSIKSKKNGDLAVSKSNKVHRKFNTMKTTNGV